MTFTEYARVAEMQYVTGQTRYEEKLRETIMKVMDKIERIILLINCLIYYLQN